MTRRCRHVARSFPRAVDATDPHGSAACRDSRTGDRNVTADALQTSCSAAATFPFSFASEPPRNAPARGENVERRPAIQAFLKPACSAGVPIYSGDLEVWKSLSGTTQARTLIPLMTPIWFVIGMLFLGRILSGLHYAQGLVVGRYLDSSGIEHGIIARIVRSGADQSNTGVTPQKQSSQAGPAAPLPLRSQVVEPAL
jgi:hypothetical protein